MASLCDRYEESPVLDVFCTSDSRPPQSQQMEVERQRDGMSTDQTISGRTDGRSDMRAQVQSPTAPPKEATSGGAQPTGHRDTTPPSAAAGLGTWSQKENITETDTASDDDTAGTW